MNYNPARDIPKASRLLKTVSPSKIAQWVRENRTELDKIGRKKQKDIHDEAITMWFTRHPDVHKKLQREIADEELNGKTITEGIFKIDVFLKIPCIDSWVLKMGGREAKQRSIKNFVNAIRFVCMGRLPRTREQVKQKIPPQFIEGWGIKHPRRLTVQDGLRYIAELKKTGAYTRELRLALRNFFKSRNLEGWDDISGKLEQQAGKYAHLYVLPENLQLILQYIKGLNPVAYRACKFALKTACRMGGMQSAHTNKINYEDHTIFVLEKATRGKPKRQQEKFISQDLWDELDLDHFKGKLFDISEQELNNICRTAYEAIIPELAKEIPMPFHFWRHQFAQHGLRKTGWNYALIAGLGHWTVETLERYYGKMDRKTRLQGASQFVHLIGTTEQPQEPISQEIEIAEKPTLPSMEVQPSSLGEPQAKAGWNYTVMANLEDGSIETVEMQYSDMPRKALLQGAKGFVHKL